MDPEAGEPVDEHDGDGLLGLDLPSGVLVRTDGNVEELLSSRRSCSRTPV